MRDFEFFAKNYARNKDFFHLKNLIPDSKYEPESYCQTGEHDFEYISLKSTEYSFLRDILPFEKFKAHETKLFSKILKDWEIKENPHQPLLSAFCKTYMIPMRKSENANRLYVVLQTGKIPHSIVTVKGKVCQLDRGSVFILPAKTDFEILSRTKEPSPLFLLSKRLI